MKQNIPIKYLEYSEFLKQIDTISPSELQNQIKIFEQKCKIMRKEVNENYQLVFKFFELGKYTFDKIISNNTKISDIIKVNAPSKMLPFKITPKLKIKIMNYHEYYAGYSITNYILTLLKKLDSSRIKIKNHGIYKIPKGEQQTIEALDKLREEYNIFYFHGYTIPFCKYKSILRFDFFCILIIDDNMYQFIIEYDEKHHFIKKGSKTSSKQTKIIPDYYGYHKRDILKQYYAKQLNINFLRIKLNANVENKITNFIKSMIKSEKYLISNKIKPQTKYLKDFDTSGLKYFNAEYERMYKINHKEDVKKYKPSELILIANRTTNELKIEIEKQFREIYCESELGKYTFNKFSNNILTLDDLCSKELEPFNIKPFKINGQLIKKIIEYNDSYTILSNKIELLRQLNQENAPKFYMGEDIVINALNELKKKYSIFYFYKYEIPICKDIEFNFFVIIIHNNKLYQFVIELERFSKTHYSLQYVEYHKMSVMKDYFLYQMNLHLLRILTHQFETINKLITNFIKKILKATTYLIINKTVPERKYLEDIENYYYYYDDDNEKFFCDNNDDELKNCIGDERLCTKLICNKCVNEILSYFYACYDATQARIYGGNILDSNKPKKTLLKKNVKYSSDSDNSESDSDEEHKPKKNPKHKKCY